MADNKLPNQTDDENKAVFRQIERDVHDYQREVQERHVREKTEKVKKEMESL